jgi:hypothetical protein
VSRVNQNRQLVGRQAEGGCSSAVPHLFDGLHFHEVISGADAAELASSAVAGAWGDLRRIRARQYTAGLRVRRVGREPPAEGVYHVRAAAGEHGVQFRVAESFPRSPAGTRGDRARELVHERNEPVTEFTAGRAAARGAGRHS